MYSNKGKSEMQSSTVQQLKKGRLETIYELAAAHSVEVLQVVVKQLMKQPRLLIVTANTL